MLRLGYFATYAYIYLIQNKYKLLTPIIISDSIWKDFPLHRAVYFLRISVPKCHGFDPRQDVLNSS